MGAASAAAVVGELTDVDFDIFGNLATGFQAAGERIFLRSGCLSCHTVGRGRLIGPDLAGVLKRRTHDWLRRWLQDPPRMLLDPALKAEFKDYPTSMPNLNLSSDDIELLVQYLGSIR